MLHGIAGCNIKVDLLGYCPASSSLLLGPGYCQPETHGDEVERLRRGRAISKWARSQCARAWESRLARHPSPSDKLSRPWNVCYLGTANPRFPGVDGRLRRTRDAIHQWDVVVTLLIYSHRAFSGLDDMIESQPYVPCIYSKKARPIRMYAGIVRSLLPLHLCLPAMLSRR